MHSEKKFKGGLKAGSLNKKRRRGSPGQKVVLCSLLFGPTESEPELLNFKKTKNRFQGIKSVSICSLAGRYNNPIPTRFLAPIDCLKIPTQILYLDHQLNIAQFTFTSLSPNAFSYELWAFIYLLPTYKYISLPKLSRVINLTLRSTDFDR